MGQLRDLLPAQSFGKMSFRKFYPAWDSRSKAESSHDDLFKSRRRLEVENLRGSDRALLVLLTRLWPSLLDASRVVQPETILRWHRAGAGRRSLATTRRRLPPLISLWFRP
jgi:hypothetical protein